MKEKKLVSIIIPTYSRPDTLLRAIDSCLNQTYNTIEILVIDDNNPNSNYRLITEKLMFDKYYDNKKVRYLKMECNSGACKARNKGIFESNGNYITFLDDDDEYYSKDSIKKFVEYISNNKYDVIFGNIYIFNDDKPEASFIHRYKKNFELTRQGLLRKHLVDIISGGISFLYKSEVLKEIGGFYNIPASQEYILMLNTIVGNYKIGYYDEICGKGHWHISEIRITGSKKAIEAKKEVIKLIKPYLKEISLNDRRKVMYRLNAFMFVQYLRKKDFHFIYYSFRLIPYLDILIISRFNKKKIINGELYI